MSPPHPGHTPTPRYLAHAALGDSAPVTVQRDGEGTPSPEPTFHLTPPSLLQPSDPWARYRPDFGFRFSFDEELAPFILSRGRLLLTPSSVLADVGPLAPRVPPAPAPPSTEPPGGQDGSVPSPDPEPGHDEGPRPGTGGDVLSAVLATPQVSALLLDVQTRFTSSFSRYWDSASVGERVGFVSGSVFVGGAMLAPLLGFEKPRDFVLSQLNNVVLPVPGLSGYGLEFRFGEHDVMVGAHLDVGLLLPSLWGFGPASFKGIGPPPGSDPNALPPLSPKADAPPGEGSARAVARGVRSPAGSGDSLGAGTRARMEAATGTDLRSVRVHTDPEADRLARTLRARAFTSGQHVFFRTGHYDPESPNGRRLLAHELAHVGQQARGDVGGTSYGGGLRVGAPGDAHEREADALAERVVRGRQPGTGRGQAFGTSRPAGAGAIVQRQPDPSASPKPVPPGEAKKMAPPPWTEYFDEVVPAVLEAADAAEGVGIERAMWLIVQAYGEQSPSVTGRPSKHRNRLFNQQGEVTRDAHNRITGVVPGQESEGVYLYDLPQNESPTRDEQVIKSSPTFGYDTPERAAHHHLDRLRERWKPAWAALTRKKGSLDQFAEALKAAGYASARSYASDLKAIRSQVRREVKAWLGYRLPEMHARRLEMEDYLDFLREEREKARRRVRDEPDPLGHLKRDLARYEEMVATMEREYDDFRAQLRRLEAFDAVLNPAAAAP